MPLISEFFGIKIYSRQLKLVLAWCAIHENELMENREIAHEHGEFQRIDPLR